MKKLPGQPGVLFDLFESLDISAHKKAVLQERYLNVLQDFQRRAGRLSVMFYLTRVTVTVGSILVPAFLSIQNSTNQMQIYWATWVMSILVTICNGLVTLFKLDKKYFFMHTTVELLHSEGWQYVGLSGHYAPKDSPITPTHENQFLVFFHMAEKIKMRQVEEEYWKFTDTSGVGNATSQKSMTTIPTPAIQQGTIANLPTPQKDIIENWIGSMSGILPRNKVKPVDTIDGTKATPQGPPHISRASSRSSLSVQSDLHEKSTSESALVPTPQVSGITEIPKNTLVQIVSD